MHVGTEGSGSDAHIFNDSELKDKIEDGSIGFPKISLIEPDGPDLPHLILADNAFALKPWLMNSYSKRGMLFSLPGSGCSMKEFWCTLTR